MTSGQSSLFDRPIDLERLKYDPVYYQELKGTILLKLFLTAELKKEFFKELDMQVLYGEGSDVLPTGVLGTEW